MTDMTAHPGQIAGPGVPTVSIEGLPAAAAGDLHTCFIPSPPGPHPPTPFTKGSATVWIGKRPALRVGDLSPCGSQIVTGAPTVLIGG
jgi:uncharacterized Zn-binding protein involved in type VI secretion